MNSTRPGLLRRLFGDSAGTAMIEFGFALPVLILVTFGSLELFQYVSVNQKMDRVAASIADLVTRSEEVSQQDLNNYFSAMDYLTKPFPFSSNGVVIVSSISRVLDKDSKEVNVINWQRSGGGMLKRDSLIGKQGGEPELPEGFWLELNENVIITEIFYTYNGLVMPWLLPEFDVYKRAVFRPRMASLNELK